MIEGFFCCAFLCALSFLFGVIYAYLQPYCRYCLYKSKNKIEWKCEETEKKPEKYSSQSIGNHVRFSVCYSFDAIDLGYSVKTEQNF